MYPFFTEQTEKTSWCRPTQQNQKTCTSYSTANQRFCKRRLL